DGRQGHARELAGAGDHALFSPDRARSFALKILKKVGIATRAFHHRTHRTRWQATQVLIGKCDGILHFAIEAHVPVLYTHRLGHGKVLHDVEQMRRRHMAFEVHDRRPNARGTLLIVDDHPGLRGITAGPAIPGAAIFAIRLWRGWGRGAL